MSTVDNIIDRIIDEASAETIPDAELFVGIDNPLTVEKLQRALDDGSIDRSTLRDAAALRMANRTSRSPRREPSQVYFIGAEATGLIKIGVAVDPQARLRTLQTGSPDRLSIIATVPGDRSMERDLHDQFADARMHGEWFRQSPGLVTFIESLLGVSP